MRNLDRGNHDQGLEKAGRKDDRRMGSWSKRGGGIMDKQG